MDSGVVDECRPYDCLACRLCYDRENVLSAGQGHTGDWSGTYGTDTPEGMPRSSGGRNRTDDSQVMSLVRWPLLYSAKELRVRERLCRKDVRSVSTS